MRPIALLAFLACSLFSSCSTHDKKNNADTDKNVGEICFEQKEGDDIVFVTMLISGDSVTGTLVKDRFETENQTGNLKGVFNDGIIKVDYSFITDGVGYINQMVFKITGDTLLQGEGEMAEQNGKFIFKDEKSVSFNNILLRVKCK